MFSSSYSSTLFFSQLQTNTPNLQRLHISQNGSYTGRRNDRVLGDDARDERRRDQIIRQIDELQTTPRPSPSHRLLDVLVAVQDPPLLAGGLERGSEGLGVVELVLGDAVELHGSRELEGVRDDQQRDVVGLAGGGDDGLRIISLSLVHGADVGDGGPVGEHGGGGDDGLGGGLHHVR